MGKWWNGLWNDSCGSTWTSHGTGKLNFPSLATFPSGCADFLQVNAEEYMRWAIIYDHKSPEVASRNYKRLLNRGRKY